MRLQKLSMLNPHYSVFGKKNSKRFSQKKKQSGTRKYTPENILIIQFIYHLVKEKGMTLEGAKKQMQVKSTDSHKQLILSKLEKIKDSLEKLKEKL